jgi:uncharacterized protein (TIGR03435 family)
MAALALAAGALGAQTPGPRPEFEVASVKPSPLTPPQQVDVGLHIDGAQVHIAYLALKDYIRIAYRVKLDQVAGPEWMASERYDVSAKLPAGASRDQVPEMLQALLEERFGLKAHRESREFAVYALTADPGGVKLKQSSSDANADAAGAIEAGGSGSVNGVNIRLGRGGYFSLTPSRIDGAKLTMEELAEVLSRFVDRPVVDQTNLSGNYDLTLDITPEDYRTLLIQSAVKSGVILPPEALRALEGASNDSLTAGLRKYGLRLEARKAPLEVVVVDQVKRTPVEN